MERTSAKAAVLRRDSISHDVMMLAPTFVDMELSNPKLIYAPARTLAVQGQAFSSRNSSIPQTPSLLLLVNRFGRQTKNFRAGKGRGAN